jgi:hypothetical protein
MTQQMGLNMLSASEDHEGYMSHSPASEGKVSYGEGNHGPNVSKQNEGAALRLVQQHQSAFLQLLYISIALSSSTGMTCTPDTKPCAKCGAGEKMKCISTNLHSIKKTGQ